MHVYRLVKGVVVWKERKVDIEWIWKWNLIKSINL